MKICLNDKMKQSIPGRVNWFFNSDTAMFMLGCASEVPPPGYRAEKRILYDGLTDPGNPHFDSDYDPDHLTTCAAIKNGIQRTITDRQIMGPDFTRQIGENRTGVAMTKALRRKRKAIYDRALRIVGHKK